MTELVFYTHPMSRGRIVRWMLEEVGTPYETVVLEYGASMKAPDYLAINPMGKVPAIRHGGQVVAETAAICAYLADAFPAAGLAPPPAARAAYYRWLFFAAGPLEQLVTFNGCGIAVPAERERALGFGSEAAVLGTLEGALVHGGYVAGEGFTAADLYLGAQLWWAMHFGMLPRRPVLERYWQRLADRPAYRRATELDDALTA
ncbi:glutathione S-transferase family protein [Siccirubricoccus sp. KC 17139]|uniref:Glutathione S-transferase family protein n=1 Tax=Siccirubricoccus soli TaxID=2899147 RepID=A0ABT1D1C3_9PROT|nr:glutathione S-transferase family protein [Siccirubricoccus soli]MCO6415716.1 glutathione S-transferase family protein [Siccirubricoccus soli]MCP2681848.1 glutathione S-transferase family protein [Siccirubricoccus soli]